MSRPPATAAVAVERFFQFALWGLVVSGYLAVAGSGYLDTPTIMLTAAGLLLRGLLIYGFVRLDISERATTLITIAYTGFYVADYFLLSREFLPASWTESRRWRYRPRAGQSLRSTGAGPRSGRPRAPRSRSFGSPWIFSV